MKEPKPKCLYCGKELIAVPLGDSYIEGYVIECPGPCIFGEDYKIYETELAALAAAQPKAVYRYAEEMIDLLRTSYYACRNNYTYKPTAEKIANLLSKLEDE